MRIKLTIEYDGGGFVGWQRQSLPGANNRSVQGELEGALKRLLGRPVSLAGAGRTDAGVHAVGQAASFEAELGIPVERLAYALNNCLPRDIRVTGLAEAGADFHARFSAKTKEYRYFFLKNGEKPDSFLGQYAWFPPYKLDWKFMQEGAALFIGEHNFRSFCAKSLVVQNYVRVVQEAAVICCQKPDVPRHLQGLAEAGELCAFVVRGNGFIYKMVRLMTGALVRLGAGKLSLADIERGLNRELAQPLAPAAPPHGLYLWRIDY